MKDYETLFDTENVLTESRVFSVAGYEFHLRLADDYSAYQLLVFEDATLVDELDGLAATVAEMSGDALATAYFDGTLQ